MEVLILILSVFMRVSMIASRDGIGRETLSTVELQPTDICPLSLKNTKLSWRIAGVGFMKDHMDMFGCLTLFTTTGDRIIMADGSGILLSVGIGYLMIHGDGVFTIMEDGTGG